MAGHSEQQCGHSAFFHFHYFPLQFLRGSRHFGIEVWQDVQTVWVHLDQSWVWILSTILSNVKMTLCGYYLYIIFFCVGVLLEYSSMVSQTTSRATRLFKLSTGFYLINSPGPSHLYVYIVKEEIVLMLCACVIHFFCTWLGEKKFFVLLPSLFGPHSRMN